LFFSAEKRTGGLIMALKGPVTGPQPSKAVFKRVTFSLTDQISEEIDRLSLVPRGFRATRSDVIRAGVAALSAMTEDQVVALLDKVHHE
jgi:hypothetical protein